MSSLHTVKKAKTVSSPKSQDLKCVFLPSVGRDAGTAAGSSDRVKGNRNLQKRKNRCFTMYTCFCSATMLTLKIITETIENHSEFSGCANSAINFFQVDLDKA